MISDYVLPSHWDKRTALWKGMPRIINLYLNSYDYEVRKWLHRQKGLILDIGCGEGRLLDYADVGVDFSGGMLERAKVKGKSLVRASVLSLPFRDSCFALGFMATVLLHISFEKRGLAVSEADRVALRFVNFDSFRVGGSRYFHAVLLRLDMLPRKVAVSFAFLFAFPLDLSSWVCWKVFGRGCH